MWFPSTKIERIPAEVSLYREPAIPDTVVVTASQGLLIPATIVIGDLVAILVMLRVGIALQIIAVVTVVMLSMAIFVLGFLLRNGRCELSPEKLIHHTRGIIPIMTSTASYNKSEVSGVEVETTTVSTGEGSRTTHIVWLAGEERRKLMSFPKREDAERVRDVVIEYWSLDDM